MASERAVAERCPNCNAFLPPTPGDGKQRRCEYCGLTLRSEPPSVLAPSPPPVSPPAPRPSPTVSVRVWPSLIVPFLVGGSIYYSTQMSIDRGRRMRSGQVAESPSPAGRNPLRVLMPGGDPAPTVERAVAVEPPSPGGKEPRERVSRSRRPVGDASLRNELCHVSGMEMEAVVRANQKTTATCFASDLASYPKEVGLTSDWEVELDGLGRVHAAQGRLHLLDYNRSPEERAGKKVPLPGPAALRCAQDIIRGWAFPKYSPKDGARMRMRCSFNLVIRDT